MFGWHMIDKFNIEIFNLIKKVDKLQGMLDETSDYDNMSKFDIPENQNYHQKQVNSTV